MKRRIFVIDDDPILQRIMKKMLSNFDDGVEVELFLHGEEAIEKLATGNNLPDLIFLDINMPIMDAWDFIENYKNLNLAAIPIYILSSSIDYRDINKAEDIDLIKDYLVKPLKKDRLIEICNRELKP
ncbi:response regulator [Reichenbachiella agarivorans]|uniref:Response regulator n=1 Tax=Reichenbachiella agarivorans TaxID=2979464 RepID=A0ABY6CLU9_9BACT|nr:response regulator [Reichenbachiella agarivorans]UXP31492.1 response regulator [Reichenbachiella agarivorans]